MKERGFKITVSLHNLYYISLCLFLCMDASFHDSAKWMFYISLAIGILAGQINSQESKNKLNSSFTIRILLFALFALFSTLWTVYPVAFSGPLKGILKYCIGSVVLLLNIKDKHDIERLISILWISGIVMAGYAFLTYGYSYILYAIRVGERLGAEIIQINGFGFTTALSICLSFRYIIIKKNWIIKSVCFLSIIPLGFCVLASESRRSVIIILVFIVLYTIFYFGASKKIWRIGIAVVALLLAFEFLNRLGLFDTIIGRFDYLKELFRTGSSTNASDEKRVNLVRLGFQYFIESPIWGHGVNSFRALSSSVYGYEVASHNNFIEILTNYGLIGFVLYYGIWLKSLITVKARKDELGRFIFVIMISALLIAELATITHTDNMIEYIILTAAISFTFID